MRLTLAALAAFAFAGSAAAGPIHFSMQPGARSYTSPPRPKADHTPCGVRLVGGPNGTRHHVPAAPGTPCQ